MKIDPQIGSILSQALERSKISRQHVMELLEIDLNSLEMYALMSAANSLSRWQFGNRGEVFAQIGINFWPCPKSCGFCSFGEAAGLIKSPLEFDREEVVAKAKAFEEAGANAIFLMTTANYPFDRYLGVAKAVRQVISPNLPLVANIGDFGPEEAKALLNAGLQGAYHALRLREGRDTRILPKTRLTTLKAIRDSALDLSYCVEPIGPEHTVRELVRAMFRGRRYRAINHAAMRRIPIPGTILGRWGEISELELAKIVAVTRLVAGDAIRAMGVHEPSLLALRAGANQIYAEAGPNPRDIVEDTTRGRGRTVEECKRMLWEAGWTPLEGPSAVFRGQLNNGREPSI